MHSSASNVYVYRIWSSREHHKIRLGSPYKLSFIVLRKSWVGIPVIRTTIVKEICRRYFRFVQPHCETAIGAQATSTYYEAMRDSLTLSLPMLPRLTHTHTHHPPTLHTYTHAHTHTTHTHHIHTHTTHTYTYTHHTHTHTHTYTHHTHTHTLSHLKIYNLILHNLLRTKTVPQQNTTKQVLCDW
jgi:hypothetical protein